MRLAVAFDLRHLCEGFPARASVRIVGADRVSVASLRAEEEAVREITVMWNRKNTPPGFGFVSA